MEVLRQALIRGLRFGLAAAVIDLALRILGTLASRIAPAPTTLAQIALESIALGAVLGLAGALFLAALPARAGAIAHLAWLAGAWLVLERWLADASPLMARGMYARALGAGALLLLGDWLVRRRPGLRPAGWLLGILGIVAGAIVPSWLAPANGGKAEIAKSSPPAPAGAPDIVLVVLDTVRAENLSAYGYARETSPTLSALAAEGALFLDATSPATWSLPAHASLFTGRYPTSHAAHGFGVPLDTRFPTLAEVLAANGYETACFTANAWISDGLGLTRGFAFQDLSWRSKVGPAGGVTNALRDRLGFGPEDKGGARVAASFEAWLRERPANAPPSFAFLNLIEAHFPHHQLPPEFRDRFTDRPLAELRTASLAVLAQQFRGPDVDLARDAQIVRDLYDGGVLYTDYLLGRIVVALRARGSLDRTVLVVLADHGEILGEHGGFFGHGPTLYQKSVSVPFVLRYPPRVPAGARVATPVSTLSAFASVLDLAALEPPPTLQAASVVPLAAEAAGDSALGGEVISELVGNQASRSRSDPQMQGGESLRAFRAGNWKLVETSAGRALLYDLASDPTETRDLAGAEPARLAELKSALEAARVRLDLPRLDEIGQAAARPAELDAETRARLEALGYVEETKPADAKPAR